MTTRRPATVEVHLDDCTVRVEFHDGALDRGPFDDVALAPDATKREAWLKASARLRQAADIAESAPFCTRGPTK